MTAAWRTREELVHQIVSLRREGVSRRAIARALGVSRNTVKAVLAAHDVQRTAEHSALPSPPARAPRAKKIDEFAARVGELLSSYPDITAQRVFETLTGEGFQGGYTAVKKYVRPRRPAKKAAPSLVAPCTVRARWPRATGRLMRSTSPAGRTSWCRPSRTS